MAPEETTGPSDPNKGFPNPHADHFDGERTPEEELEYRRQQLSRDVAAGDVEISEPRRTPDEVPASPTGTPEAAW